MSWSAALLFAERSASQSRGESELTWRDAITMGLVQCVALVPGVSRAGATISAGLLYGLGRVTASRMAFFLGIPSLTAAGLYGLKDVSGIGVGPAVVGTLVSFVVAYASVAWLLKFVAPPQHRCVRAVPRRSRRRAAHTSGNRCHGAHVGQSRPRARFEQQLRGCGSRVVRPRPMGGTSSAGEGTARELGR
ncbi:undecaprenyl-diphosphate phosphatase [Aeromicrobium stalagmiti]|uniref:undecaprenyl-diphosphate phosphatase n=1 Tax=Aeromicrobium stalagmiti TaxID=2738988 RepID=UPI0020C44909|nr:undecaprenyl-diphosphate phosphatase [Aeromicrobium stalagmiti]